MAVMLQRKTSSFSDLTQIAKTFLHVLIPMAVMLQRKTSSFSDLTQICVRSEKEEVFLCSMTAIGIKT